MDCLIQALFPAHRVWVDDSRVESTEDCSLFSIIEIVEAVFFMKNKTVSGLDFFPLEVGEACAEDSELPTNLYA